ncbi:MAG: ATP-binding protein [Acidobacteriota bacterium]
MSQAIADKTLRLTVDNIGFLLDRLGEDCHPLQFLRELTQNSIEAILRTPERTGEIVWDVDWTSYELGDHRVFKLCVTDNGDGMTGEEMRKFINQLSSSIARQASDGNYGVGAKIAAATRNHTGLIYLSWKNGDGAMILFGATPRRASMASGRSNDRMVRLGIGQNWLTM